MIQQEKNIIIILLIYKKYYFYIYPKFFLNHYIFTILKFTYFLVIILKMIFSVAVREH